MANGETAAALGQGLAQVIDDSRAYQEFVKGRDRALELALQQKEKQDAKKGQLFTSIGKTLSAETWFRDTPFFQKQAQDIKDFTERNLDRLLNNDPQATLELETMMGNYLSSAKDSKDAREVFEAAAAKLDSDKQGLYDRELSMKNLQDAARGEAADYSFTEGPLLVPKTKEINLIERAAQKFGATIARMKGERVESTIDPVTGREITTSVGAVNREQLKDLFRADAASAEVLAQATREYEKLSTPEKLKFGSATEYYAETAADALMPAVDRKTDIGQKIDDDEKINWDRGTAATDKFRFAFKDEQFEAQPAPGIRDFRFAGRPPIRGARKVVDISPLTKGELGTLKFPYKGKQISGTVTEVYQDPGRSWKVEFTPVVTGELDLEEGQTIELDYDSVKEELISKYGVDIPTLWEEHQQRLGGDERRGINVDAQGQTPGRGRTFDHSNLN